MKPRPVKYSILYDATPAERATYWQREARSGYEISLAVSGSALASTFAQRDAAVSYRRAQYWLSVALGVRS